MPAPPHGPYRVRLDGLEREVPELDDLVAMAQAGVIDRDTPVRPPGEAAWRPAAEVTGLAAAFPVDPWAAWDDADEDSMEEALGAVHGPGDPEDFDDLPTHPGGLSPDALRASELDPAAISPLDGDAPPADVEELPAAALAPIEGGGEPAPPPAPRGKVIAFPGGRPASPPATDGSAALHPDPAPIPLRPPTTLPVPPPREEPTGPRWGRVAAIASLGLLVVVALNGYVSMTAAERYGPPGGADAGPAPAIAQPEVQAEPEPEAAPAPRVPTTMSAGPYADIEREIRSQWLADPRDLVEPTDLEDALYVELPRVHVQVVRAKAPITEWGGRRSAQPQAANFLIRYEARPGERDRELAAIALVVGRYMSIYKLRSDQLTIESQTPSGGTRRIAVDPTQALRLYEQRITLVEFLEQLAAG